MAFFVSIKRKLVSIISSSYGSKRVDDEEEEEDRQRTCKRQRRGAHPPSNPVSESTTTARSMAAVISDSCKQLTATICCRILTIVLGGVSVCLAKRSVVILLHERSLLTFIVSCNQCRLGQCCHRHHASRQRDIIGMSSLIFRILS